MPAAPVLVGVDADAGEESPEPPLAEELGVGVAITEPEAEEDVFIGDIIELEELENLQTFVSHFVPTRVR